MWLDREGLFKAAIAESGLQDTKESQALAFVCKFDLLAMWNGTEWEDWSSYGAQCYGNFWILKKDGSPNKDTCESVAEAVGWNGDLLALNADLRGHEVQIFAKRDEYQGNVKFKAAYLHKVDAEPTSGIRAIDEAAIKQLQNRYGSQLRALVGGTKKPDGSAKPPTPAGKPPSKAPASTQKPPTPTSNMPTCATLDDAWEWFKSQFKPDVKSDSVEAEWHRVIEQVFHCGSGNLTPDQIKTFPTSIHEHILPF